jgi:hypothetical protein
MLDFKGFEVMLRRQILFAKKQVQSPWMDLRLTFIDLSNKERVRLLY